MQISEDTIYLYLISTSFSMVRVLAAMTVLPLFARGMVPPMTRTLMSVAFSLILLPALIQQVDLSDLNVLQGFLILIKEIAIGVLIGFSFGLVFWAMETVGHFIDFQSGLTFSQSVDPMLGVQTSVSARVTLQVFTIYFIVIGGIKVFLEAIYASHAVWPIMTFFPTMREGWVGLFSDQTSLLFSLGLLFAAPALILLLLVEFGVGLLNSAAPNMNVFDTLRPVKQWLAFLVLFITIPFILMRTLEIVGRMRNIIPMLQEVM